MDHCLGVQDESSSPSLVASTLFSGNQHSVIGAFAAVHSSTETETRATAEVASAVARFIDPSAVAYTYVSGGGRATFDDYYAAFALGFVVGTTIASVYQGFQLAGEAALARAGPAARAGAEARAFSAVGTDLNRGVAAEERIALEAPDVVSRETPLVQGTFHGVDTEGYVIEGRFVPQIEGGSGDVQGLRAKIGVDDVFENPNVLRDMPGRLKTPNEVSDLIADAQSRGLRSTRLSWGSQEGSGLKLLDTDDGRMIMYHPGGGHHGEYWKVSSGITRTTRVFPDFTEYPNGWVEVWR